jgi:hypothetical protein
MSPDVVGFTLRGVAGSALRAGALAALVTAAHLVPAFAPVVMWPALLVAPGWWLLDWAGGRLGAAERCGLAVVLSLAISTHLVFWLALATGAYDGTDVSLAAFIGLLPVALAMGRSRPARWRTRVLDALRGSSAAFLLAALPAAFVAVVLASSIWSVDGTGLRTSALLWSDLLVHLSIATSVNAGNFPPEVPFFAGETLTYHWFADFAAAIAARAAGVYPIVTFVALNTLLAFALGLVVFGLALRLLGDRRAAHLAMVLGVLAGGMGYLRFFKDWMSTGSDPWQLLTRITYDNRWLTDWPYFYVPSVLGTGLLSHRATTAGLPMLVGTILLLAIALPPRRPAKRADSVASRNDQASSGAVPAGEGRADVGRETAGDPPRFLLLAGALAALSAPFHYFFFPAILLLSFFYVVTAGRLLERAAWRNAALFAAPLLLAVPHVVTPLAQATGGDRLQLRLWWDAPVTDGPAAVAFFYVTNLGVPFLLGLAALVHRGLPRRLFLGAWIVAMFAIPNVTVFSAVSFDMNKYFQAMWIGCAIAAAWLIRRWHPVLAGAAIALTVASPIQVGVHGVSERYGVISAGEVRAAAWAAGATAERSVFVTDGWLHSFTDLAGRLRLTSFGPYVANLGYDPEPREEMVREIYCGGDASRSAVLAASLGAQYVVDAGRPRPCTDPVAFDGHPAFELAFDDPSVRVWRLRDAQSGSADR